MPLLTVLVASRNRIDYLRRLLRSIQRSTFTDYEVILIDDASDEDLHPLVDAFNDSRFRYFRQERRQGCWAAFNRGIREAKGTWLCALGSDDLIESHYLERIACATATAFEIDYLYPEAFRIIDAEDNPTGEVRTFHDFAGEQRNLIPAIIFRFSSGPVPHAGAFIRRDVYDRFGFYDELPNVQDTVYMAKHYQQLRFRKVQTDLGYRYRVHDDNTSMASPEDRNRSLAGAIEHLLKVCPPQILCPQPDGKNDPRVFAQYVEQVLRQHAQNTREHGGEAYLEALRRWKGEPAPVRVTPVRKRIAVLADQNNRNFLRNFLPYLQARHDVTILDANQAEAVERAAETVDAMWVEWTERWALRLSQFKHKCRLVCRLHSYEAYLPEVQRIRWDNVDAIVFLSPQIKAYVEEKCPALPQQTQSLYISEGVDVTKFAYRPRQHGTEMIYVGNLIQTKNIALLMQVFRYCLDLNPNFRLHLVGEYQADAGVSPEIPKRYLEHIIREMGVADKVRFHGQLPQEQVVPLLQQANYIVSTSFREGLPFSVLEGMATGMMPLVHNWPGAKLCFPERYVFNYLGELRNQLAQPYDSAAIRNFVETEHNLANSLPLMEKALLGE